MSPVGWAAAMTAPGLRQVDHLAPALAFIARLVSQFGDLPLEDLALAVNPHDGYRLEAHGVIATREELQRWAQAAGQPITSRETAWGKIHHALEFDVAGVRLRLVAIESFETTDPTRTSLPPASDDVVPSSTASVRVVPAPAADSVGSAPPAPHGGSTAGATLAHRYAPQGDGFCSVRLGRWSGR